MFMVVVVKVTDLTTCMVLTHVGLPTGVVHNQQVTNKVTMLTDINPMLHGVLEVTDHNLVTEVPEVERESWWFTNTTVN